MIDSKHRLQMKSIRLEALGDGIFSIAMTIMVIELAIPVVKGNGWADFLSALKLIGSDFLCYFISFVVLGIMWYGHRMMFEYIGHTDRYFIFLGVLFYMVICLVPFSTRILAHETLKWYSILVYAVNLSLCNLSLYIQWLYGIKKPALMERELPGEVKKEARILFLISPGLYAVAIAFSFFIPEVSIGIFIITPLLYLLPNKLDRYMP